MANPDALIFISARQHMLISDDLTVRKNYFNSNMVQNEKHGYCDVFSKNYFEADVDRSAFLHTTSSWRQFLVC